MAKYETSLRGDFRELLEVIHSAVVGGSFSAELEDGSDCAMGDVRCAVRVYERYSMLGKNRVSLSVTVMARGDDLFLSAIASGGSQAVFFKVNTWGEHSFLDTLISAVEGYKHGR